MLTDCKNHNYKLKLKVLMNRIQTRNNGIKGDCTDHLMSTSKAQVK